MTLDTNWKLEGRAAGGASYTTRWTGGGGIIPAWGHFLITGTAYGQTPAFNETLTSGITDASAVRLVHLGTTIDTVCYYYGALSFDSTYACEGTAVLNPHNNAASTDVDKSIERKPGGAGGNCTDTNDNASDFITQAPATPQNASSPPTP